MDRESGSLIATATDLEIELLLEAIFTKYHYDFRCYARASLRRRLLHACARFGCRSISMLQDRVLHETEFFPALLDYLTIQVSDMFRDPSYFRSLRQNVVPMLQTYPSLRIWIAGCSTGEEAYSMAVLLREEGLLDRTTIYATDINPVALHRAQSGVYDIDRIAGFTRNYQATQPKASLSDYYTARYGAAVFDRGLRRDIVFADHSLATDQVFTEAHLISCRNVLIYFKPELQSRSFRLFRDSLCRNGFLGLGAKESLRFSELTDQFEDFDSRERIFRRK